MELKCPEIQVLGKGRRAALARCAGAGRWGEETCGGADPFLPQRLHSALSCRECQCKQSLGSFVSKGRACGASRSCPSCVWCFPNAVLWWMLGVNLISGLRKGERRRKEGESAGEAAGASDNARKHQLGLNLLCKCDVNSYFSRICRFQKSFIYLFFFLVSYSFKNPIRPQMPRID